MAAFSWAALASPIPCWFISSSNGARCRPDSPPKHLQQALSHLDRILAGHANPQKDGDQFGLAQRLCAQRSQSFAWAVGFVEVGDAVGGAGIGFGHGFPSVKRCTYFTTESLLDTPLATQVEYDAP